MKKICTYCGSEILETNCRNCGNILYKIVYDKEESSMKLIYKSPMTDVGQREAFRQLIDVAMFTGYSEKTFNKEKFNKYIDKAIEIAKNDSKEIDYISIDVSNITYASENGGREARFKPEQIEEAYRLIKG